MPPRWSADCLNELAIKAGFTVSFYDPDSVQLVKDRADTLWGISNRLVDTIARADASGERASLTVWEMERLGESPEGAALIEARRYDATAASTVSQYRATIATTPSCPFPRLNRAPDAIERAVRAVMAEPKPSDPLTPESD